MGNAFAGGRFALVGSGGMAALLASACFASSWWQQEAAQRNIAQRQAPHALEATAPAPGDAGSVHRAAARVLRIRAYATPQYASEIVDWRPHFTELLDDANRIVEPTVGIRWELADTGAWTAPASESLDALLEKLRQGDAGDGVDWVVGLVGSLPVLEMSFHHLGVGQVLGKHLIVRATSDLHERQAIKAELWRLSEAEQEGLYEKRRRHKATAVFLHEMGHTLGVIHETDPTSLMSPRYDAAESAFSPASVEIMSITVEHRWGAASDDERAYAERLLAAFQRSRDTWVASDRDAMLASLRQKATPAPPASAMPARAPTAEEIASLQGVADDDRALYERALEHERGNRPDEAWKTAAPLFSRYPDAYVIQDLRCRLALQLSSVWQQTRRECQRLMDLSRGKPAPSK